MTPVRTTVCGWSQSEGREGERVTNDVGDQGATAIANNLTNLTTLNLDSNSVGDQGATAIANNLTNLTSLELYRNNVSADGVNGVLGKIRSWRDPTRITRLDLRQGADLSGILPDEVIENFSDAQAILAAYRRFTSEEDDLVPLNEAKMLVVGDEAVGKTSLIRFLTSGQPRNPDEQRTMGAEFHEEIETTTWPGASDGIKLNIWDFGGQEIYWGTHRFFLTRRSIYLLVLSARLHDGSTSAFDWMKTIRNRAEDSPVVVVINKCDDGEHNLAIDLTKLRENYPEIVAVVPTSCDATQFGHQSIETLKRTIAATLADPTQMPHVADKVPRSWLRIKDAVAELAAEVHYLPRHRFVELCQQDETPIEIDSEHDALLTTLNNLGVIVYHRRETQVLDPNWLTQGIYTVLDSRLVREANGEFDRDLLAALLPQRDYPPDVHDYIITMMEDHDIGMCFALRDRPGHYLVPEALPANEPHLAPAATDALQLRYRYEFLPKHVIPRFIVEAHDYLSDRPTAWQTGAVLEAAECRVEVRGDRDKRKIEFAVSGPSNRRRDAMNSIVGRLKVVHDLNPEIGPQARIPLPGHNELDVSHQHLLDLEAKHGPDYRWEPEDAGGQDYRVGDLLHGLQLEPDARQVTTRQQSTQRPEALDGDQDWTRATIIASLVAMAAAALVATVGFAFGQAQLALALAAIFAVGGLVAAAVWRRNPARVWHRYVSYALTVGMAAHAIGFSFEAYGDTEDGSGGLRWSGSTGVAFTVVWGVVVVALIGAALTVDLRRERSAASTP